MNKLLISIKKADLMSIESETIIDMAAIKAAEINHLELSDHEGLNKLYFSIKEHIRASKDKELSISVEAGQSFYFSVSFYENEVFTCKSVKIE